MKIITASHLRKCYNSLCALNNVDFSIEEGECFGFLGPNGAGKTTAMSLIYCYMPPTSGELSVFGLNVSEHASEIKSRLGVMPQDNNLDPDLSVIENLIVYARYFDVLPRESVNRAGTLLNFVELQEKANVNIQKLSGGMKRRLLLARALINNPELLVLDEPTTGLDPHSRHSVWEQLMELKKRGMTLLLTTHYMEEAQELCDRVAIMDAGRIIEREKPSVLMEKYKGDLETVYLKLTGKSLEG